MHGWLGMSPALGFSTSAPPAFLAALLHLAARVCRGVGSCRCGRSPLSRRPAPPPPWLAPSSCHALAEVLAAAPAKPLSSQPILDMRGPQARLVTNLEHLNMQASGAARLPVPQALRALSACLVADLLGCAGGRVGQVGPKQHSQQLLVGLILKLAAVVCRSPPLVQAEEQAKVSRYPSCSATCSPCCLTLPMLGRLIGRA